MTVSLDALDRQLLIRYQKYLPICAEPYQLMAEELNCSEEQVIEHLKRLQSLGVLSRIGPVFEHRRAGASTLAALAVPEERVEAVAAYLNTFDEINHNYQREHHYNLWVVVTAENQTRLNDILDTITAVTGLSVLDLPMVEGYRIDLAFPLPELEDQEADA